MTKPPSIANTERPSQTLRTNIDREHLDRLFRSVTRSHRNIQRSIRILGAAGSVTSDQVQHLMPHTRVVSASPTSEA